MTDPRLDAARLLRRAAGAAKCGPCGCARGAADDVQRANVGGELLAAADELAAALAPERYDCLGCAVCWPAQALGLLTDAGVIDAADVDACAAAPVDERTGWPPLPGAYSVLRWAAPVAVCALADGDLAAAIARAPMPGLGIVGTLATENLGIERLVRNTIANPNLRFVVVCGAENDQRIGHRPGASLIALARNGVNDRQRIIDAPSRRPFLHNLDADDITTFRDTVEVVDLVGETDLEPIASAIAGCAARDPGPADRRAAIAAIPTVAGQLPSHMNPDRAGYFVIDPDRRRGVLHVEHYANDGTLDVIIEGPTPAHCYMAAIDSQLVSQLDHAAYLGRELSRAHTALLTDTAFVQDAAPERSSADDPSTPVRHR